MRKIFALFFIFISSCGTNEIEANLFTTNTPKFSWLKGVTRDLAMSETDSRIFYESFVNLAKDEARFRKAIKHGYDAVPWAQSAPCATTTSAVIEQAFKDVGMKERAAIFHNHDKFALTHEVEKMLYRLGFNYYPLNKYQVQIGVGLLAGRFTFHGTSDHSGHVYTTLWMKNGEVMIGDNGGYNHPYRGNGYQAGTEGIWLPSSIIPQSK